LVVLALAGCGSPSTPPPAAPAATVDRSRFLAETPVPAIVERCVAAPDRVPQWGTKGYDGSSAGGSALGHREVERAFGGMFFYQTAAGARVDCGPEEIDRFLRAIALELENALGASGARVLRRTDNPDRPGSLLRGFRIAYNALDPRGGPVAHGTIVAEAGPDDNPPGLTRLTITIRETVRND
jgi:hypothetical protein